MAGASCIYYLVWSRVVGSGLVCDLVVGLRNGRLRLRAFLDRVYFCITSAAENFQVFI